MFSHLADYLMANNIIPHNLHGIRAGHSTTIALIYIYEKLVENHEKGVPRAILTMDHSSVYEICNYQVMLDKMELLGLDNNTIAWMKSYLGGRTQVVEIQTKISPEIKLPPTSVIQGSIGS